MSSCPRLFCMVHNYPKHKERWEASSPFLNAMAVQMAVTAISSKTTRKPCFLIILKTCRIITIGVEVALWPLEWVPGVYTILTYAHVTVFCISPWTPRFFLSAPCLGNDVTFVTLLNPDHNGTRNVCWSEWNDRIVFDTYREIFVCADCSGISQMSCGITETLVKSTIRSALALAAHLQSKMPISNIYTTF